MNRRQFLKSSLVTSIAVHASSRLFAKSASQTAVLTLDKAASRRVIPLSFSGLSYESSQLANPGYLSRENKKLVTLVRQLGSRGVLRIGGSTSDFDRWSANESANKVSWFEPANPDTGETATVRATITRTAIDELRTFLDATGWSLIYGLDLGHGSPKQATNEAAYAIRTIGPALIALQIGNEPDLFPSNDIRHSPYRFSNYMSEWELFASSIRRRIPNAPLAGPDIADNVDWVGEFAKQARGVRLLTSHYYAEGPPSSPDADIDHLLQNRAELHNRMTHLVAVGKSVGLPYRMAEGNSCYDGGKSGVSDSFASALWGADFMLLLAELGVAGVNFHGGGYGHYTPIAGGGSTPLEPRPLYYGMLFFKQFASGSMIPCKLDAGNVNATAYACLNARGRLAIAIVNKDQNTNLELRLNGAEFTNPSNQLALQAPRLDSMKDVTLGDKGVSPDGIWSGGFTPRASTPEVVVPRASALIMMFENVQV